MITKYTGSEKGSDVADTTPKGVYIPSDLEKRGLKLIGFDEAEYNGDSIRAFIPADSAYRHFHIVAHVETYVDETALPYFGISFGTTPHIDNKCQWTGIQYSRSDTTVGALSVSNNGRLIDIQLPNPHMFAQYNIDLTRTSSTANWWNYTATANASHGIFRSIGGVISAPFDHFDEFHVQHSDGTWTGYFMKGSYIAVYGSKY